MCINFMYVKIALQNRVRRALLLQARAKIVRIDIKEPM